MAIASMLASWFTPTVLFCVLNLMIAIIFLASNFKSPNNHHNNPSSPSQLTRSPSLLQRVKSSVNSSSFYTGAPDDQTAEYNSVSQPSQAPSLLQRVRSIDYSFSSFYTPNYHNSSSTTEPEQVGNSSTSELTRAPSLLDRVKSFKLTSSFHSNHNSSETNTTMQDEQYSNMDAHLEDHDIDDVTISSSGNSRNNKLAKLSQNPEMTLAKRSSGSNLSKSSSEKRVAVLEDDEDVDRRRPATMRAPSETRDECVDAKADDFIKRFKQHLKLQRIDSLQRFREMLNRGT
uniref:pathogen-associated molecular patterns-induced protein A70 n=1 Tax=Erigeron canadensis TaxID=72917 RepID=UPI001CB8B424|nr:pathogen-associated molecular patterns-induced protein A70 [Erigeron canadensis]